MSTTDFLLELRSEEIPARMQGKARDDLARLFATEIAKAGLVAATITTYATPRRLALIATGLPLETAAVSEETKGPKVGAPPQAMEGFMRKTGLRSDQLVERDGVYFAVVERPGCATADVLSEAIPSIISAFPWPKSMRWGVESQTTESLRWVRPLHGIVALLGGEVVGCAVGGIASGHETIGHRFMGQLENPVRPEPVEGLPFSRDEKQGGASTSSARTVIIGNAGSYSSDLRAAHVIVDQDERASIIRDGAAKLANERGLSWIADEALAQENAGLTEWPVPLLGDFDPAFLAVPPEVIRLTLATNQKYFVCADAAGNLAPAFIATSNISAKDGGAGVIAGNRKVLSARLSDARFFWEQDKKTPLEIQAAKLSRITFHEKLGTVADKVERVAKLARWLVENGIVKPVAGQTKEHTAYLAGKAAELCKADLVTEMVGEFPELQGIMGGYYARAKGLPDAVADAIRDHYRPVGQSDDVPTAPVTVAVSLADKLDTLFAFFSINEGPTGSRDPFALRRQTLGILSLLVENSLRLPLTKTLEAVGVIYHIQYVESRAWDIPGLAQRASDFLSKLPVFDSDAFNALDEMVETSKEVYLVSLPETSPDPEDPDTRFNQERRLGAMFRAYTGWHRWFADWEDVLSVLPPIISFVGDRLKVQQREAGIRHDLIDAVFALGGEDDLVRLLARVKALQAFVETPDGANLLAGYKRAANILKQGDDDTSPARGGGPRSGGGVSSTAVEPLHHPAAKALDGPLPRAGEVLEAETTLLAALDLAEPLAAAAIEAEDFAAAMTALASLRAPIDAFFDGVMVNDPDVGVRVFRLGLLSRFVDAVHKVADFSKIAG